MDARRRFEEHAYERIAGYLASNGESYVGWPDEPKPYVMSLFVYDEDDDPKRPTVTLSFECPPHPENDGDDAVARWHNDPERQWNYACFGQSDDVTIGMDDEGRALVADLLRGLDWEDCTPYFVSALISIVQRVHRERLTERFLGTTFPLLIHELEYYQEIARQNVEANGLERVASFVDWIRAWYRGADLRHFDAAMREAETAYLLAVSEA